MKSRILRNEDKNSIDLEMSLKDVLNKIPGPEDSDRRVSLDQRLDDEGDGQGRDCHLRGPGQEQGESLHRLRPRAD